MANGKDGTWVTIGGAKILLGSPAHTALLKRIQQRRQGVKDTARGMEEAQAMFEAADLILTEVAPPGWSGTTKAMKKHKGISNPFALSWWMKNQGAEPHKAPEKKEAAVQYVEELVNQATRIMEAVGEEAGTSAGAKAGWEKRKGGGGAATGGDDLINGKPGISAGPDGKATGWLTYKGKRGARVPADMTVDQAKDLERRMAIPNTRKPTLMSDGTVRQGKHTWASVDAYKKMGGDVRGVIKVAPGRDFTIKKASEVRAVAYEVLEDLDRLIEALDAEAGTSSGAKAGWEKRKGGGGGDAPQHGAGKEIRRMAKRADKDLQGINAPVGERKKMSGMFAGALAKHAMRRAFPEKKELPSDPKFWVGTNLGPKEKVDPEWGTLPGGQVRRHRSSEAAQPVRATLVIREAAGMSSLPQLGRAGARVPGRSGSGLVRKDNGAVERVPVQKDSFHDDLRRKTSLRRVMHKNPPPAKVGAA